MQLFTDKPATPTLGRLVTNWGDRRLVLQEVLPRIHSLINKTIVIQLDGGSREEQESVLQDIVLLRSLHVNLILVHSGGSGMSGWLRQADKESHIDEETMISARMGLVGQINQELVRLIIRLGGRAIGLSGLDDAMICAVRDDEAAGFVGNVNGEALNLRLLQMLVEAGYIPVIAPIGIDEHGECLNISADSVAAEIARTLQAEKLILLTDGAGIGDYAGQRISELSVTETLDLIDQQAISGDMIPKVQACIRALETVHQTRISDGRIPHILIHELLTDGRIGSIIMPMRI